tara:strand:+ start:18380 stop:25696 length:7317 start_codon:yes stop_codon:yes gene_type:complete
MSCKNDIAYKQLVNAFKDDKIATEKYEWLKSIEFASMFGEWQMTDKGDVNRNREVDPNSSRTNDDQDNTPKLNSEFKNGRTIYYYVGKNQNKIDVTPRAFEYLDIENRTTKVNEVVNGIADWVFKNNIEENFNDLSSIESINLDEEIDGYFKDISENPIADKKYLDSFANFSDEELAEENYTREQYEDDILLMDELFKLIEGLKRGKEELKYQVSSLFKSKGLTINQETDSIEEEDEVEDNSERGEKLNSVEQNTKDKASANVKLMLSFLPFYKLNPEFNGVTNTERFVEGFDSMFANRKLMDGNVVHESLLKDLSDLVTSQEVDGVTDLYKTMRVILLEKSVNKPYYRDLVNTLDSVDENKRSEFVAAMMHSKNKHIVSDNNIKEGKFKTFDAANQTSIESKITKNWQEMFNAIFTVDGKLDDKMVSQLITKMSKVTKNSTAIFSGKDLSTVSVEQFNKYVSRAVFGTKDSLGSLNILNDIGLNSVTKNVIFAIINNVEPNLSTLEYRQQVKLNIDNLNKSIQQSIIDLKNNKLVENYAFVENNKSRLFDELAEYVAVNQSDIKDSTVYSMNKMFWAYGNPSYLSNAVAMIKENPDMLKEIQKNTINKNSQWIEYLLAEEVDEENEYVYDPKNRLIKSNKRINDFYIGRMLQYQDSNNIASATDNKNISIVDQTIDRINKVMQGSIKDESGVLTKKKASLYATIVPADKSTSFELALSYFVDDTLSEMEISESETFKKSLIFSEKTKNIFFGYFTDEFNRMVEARETIKAFEALSSEEKVKQYRKLNVHFHVKAANIVIDETNSENNNYGIRDDKGNLLGEAFKSQITPEINYTSLQEKMAGSNLFNSDGSVKDAYGKDSINEDQKKIIKDIINEMMKKRVVSNVSTLIQQGVITKLGNNKYKINAISRDVQATYNVEKGVFTQPSIYQLISDYTLNSIIANVEYTKLFTGDPAYYKNMVDFFKRVPATYTDGTQLRLGITDGDGKFNMAVVENQIIGSEFYNDLEQSIRDVNKNITEEELADIIGAYKEGVNQTDAQGWITPQRWKFIIERTGKGWSSAHDVVYDKMMGKNTEDFTVKELKLSAQPLKGVYFGVVDNVPTYIKYSQAVLSPMLVKGNELQYLYDSMTKDENSNELPFKDQIHEAVTLDGVKVGAKIPSKMGEGAVLNKQVLNNSEWKLQQDLPIKLMKQTLLGSQIQKNIYSTVLSDSIYDVDGVDMDGNAIVDHINDIISSLSNNGTDKLSLMLGKDNENKIDKDALYEIVQSEIDDNPDQYTQDVKDAVRKQIPFEAMPALKNKLYSIFFAKIRKSASNIKTNGGSFIQMSNYALDQKTANENGVTWLVDQETGLKPPTIYRDKKGVLKQRPGQIFISHSDIAKHIPNYRSMERKELLEKIDSNLLKAIGYRIPNQGMSSNDALEIVGILPPHMNDTVVAYSEITTKTGSDFDIDKMYVMLPEFKTLYSKESTNSAISFLKRNDYTLTEIKEELKEDGYTDDSIEYLENPFEEYVNEVFLKKQDIELYNQYVKEYGIGKIYKLVKTKSNKDSTKGMNNMLFDAYWAVLTNKDTYTDLIKPIDFDYLQNHIKSMNETQDSNENFKFYDGLYQLGLKNTYMLGKSGVGISANMAVDHNISKDNKVNLSFYNYYLGVGYEKNEETVFDTNPENGTSLSVELSDKDAKAAAERINKNKGENEKVSWKTIKSFKIGDTISSFMNAFVDNAKDPYIEKGNYNTYTSSTAFMLTRAGVHPYWTDAFIGQPVLKELSKFVKDYESISIEKDKANSGMSAFDILLNKKISKYAGTQDKSVIRKTLANITKNKRNIYNYSDLIESYDKTEDNVSAMQEIELLLTFKEFQEQSKKLDASVNLSRFDTLGSGRDFNDMMIYQNNLINIFNNEYNAGGLNGHRQKYVRNGKLTSLGSQLKNSVFFASDILNANEDLFLSANKAFLNVVNEISMNTPRSRGGSMGRATNKEFINRLSKDLYTSLMSKYPLFKMEGSPLVFVKGVKSRLIEYKNNEDKEFPNAFVQALTFYKDSFGLDIGRIPTGTKDNMSNAFYDIYKKDKSLAIDIIKSSFAMTGFNQSLIDFNEMIPHEFFLQHHKIGSNSFQSIEGFIKQELIAMNNSSYMSNFHKQYVQNNYDDNVAILTVDRSSLTNAKSSKDLLVLTNEYKLSNYRVASRTNRDGSIDMESVSYAPYLKINEDLEDEAFNYMDAGQDSSIDQNAEAALPTILEYKGNMTYISNGKKVSRPIYQKIEARGYKNKKSKVHYKEYNTRVSSFRDNKDNVSDKSIVSVVKAISKSHEFMPAYMTASYGEDNRLRSVEGLEDFIFKNSINEIAETIVNQENVVSLQEESIETLRQQEIQEFKDNGLNATDFITDGKIDVDKVNASNNQKAKEVYDKYDKLITESQNKKEQEQTSQLDLFSNEDPFTSEPTEDEEDNC